MPSPFPPARAHAVVAGAVATALALAATAGGTVAGTPAVPRGEWKAAAQVPVRFVARLVTTGCAPDSIPQVALTGTLEVGALGARIAFVRGDAGPTPPTGKADAEGRVDLLPAGTTIAIPPHVVRAEASDSLFCFVQLEDARGRPLSDPLLAGRCVDGAVTREVAGMLPVDVDALARSEGCGDRQGARISLTGSVRMGGVWARVTFRATPDPLVSPPAAAAVGVSRDVSLLAPGHTAAILGPPAYGAAGGNPTLYAQLMLGSGVTGPLVRLGRCADLAP